MNFPEITALAREYAEKKARADREQGFPEPFINDMIELYKKDMKSALDFLLRRFCLVEKELMEDEYNKTLKEAKLAHPKHQIQSRTRMRLLKSLFPEIAKEVEE